MSDEATLEDIRIAKEHLEKALARAVNRDSLERWANPPTYRTDTQWQQNIAAVDLDTPNEYDSLSVVPPGVAVRDKDGDQWKVSRRGKLKIRWRGGGKWEDSNPGCYPLSTWAPPRLSK